MGEYQKALDHMKALSRTAYDKFIERNPTTFYKAFFKTHSKCDSIDNNLAETFNSFILLARYKPIVTMLEDIRLAIMVRMSQKKKLKFFAGVSPRVSEKMKRNLDESVHAECLWNGEDSQWL